MTGAMLPAAESSTCRFSTIRPNTTTFAPIRNAWKTWLRSAAASVLHNSQDLSRLLASIKPTVGEAVVARQPAWDNPAFWFLLLAAADGGMDVSPLPRAGVKSFLQIRAAWCLL